MMTPEEMRIAIAEKCGWQCVHAESYADGKGGFDYDFRGMPPKSSLRCVIPDYPNDLNKMREAILALDSIQVVLWAGELYGIARSNHEDKDVALLVSSAAQQAEAYCRVFWPKKFK